MVNLDIEEVGRRVDDSAQKLRDLRQKDPYIARQGWVARDFRLEAHRIETYQQPIPTEVTQALHAIARDPNQPASRREEAGKTIDEFFNQSQGETRKDYELTSQALISSKDPDLVKVGQTLGGFMRMPAFVWGMK